MIIIIHSQRSLLGNDTVDSGPRFSQESDAYADNIFMRISTLQVDIYNWKQIIEFIVYKLKLRFSWESKNLMVFFFFTKNGLK